MAEQSIGFASGSGDGVAGGYPADRMLLMETKTLNNGVMQYGGLLALSGTGTATLTIAEGAAIVAGYFYENTASLTINVSTLANKTYNLVGIVNATAGTLAVSRSATGTTTPAYSVRIALYDGTPAVPYLLLGTVQVTSASIAAITPSYTAYAETRQLPYQSYATMTGGSATLTTANTTYDVTGYTASTVSSDNVFSVNTTTGEITVRRTGLYLVNVYGSFQSGTTGYRLLGVLVNGSFVQSTRAAAPGVSAHNMTQTSLVSITAVTDVVKIAAVSSIATQTYSSGTFTIARV